MIWYRAYFDNVFAVDVVKETNTFVVIKNSSGKEYKTKKSSEYDSFHKTKDDAFNWLVERQKKKIAHLKNQIECHEREIVKIKGVSKVKKKIGDLTLREISEICNINVCSGCKLSKEGRCIFAYKHPNGFDLNYKIEVQE